MASKVAQKRLQKEYLSMQKSPPPFIWAVPEESNILNWHFIVRGPPDSPYDGGEYHGLIWFPPDYPFKPPDVKLFTPSGRFEVGHKICMSMTSYHPTTWNAAWSVATILTGLLSFMLTDDVTAGMVRTTVEQKKVFAQQSHDFNLKSKKFREIFPAYATPEMTDLPDMGKGPTSSASAPPTTASSTKTSTPIPSRPASTIPVVAETNTNINAEKREQVHEQELEAAGGGWLSWRLVVVVALLAVLGRISIYAGRT